VGIHVEPLGDFEDNDSEDGDSEGGSDGEVQNFTIRIITLPWPLLLRFQLDLEASEKSTETIVLETCCSFLP
jgi:hypothetical protein